MSIHYFEIEDTPLLSWPTIYYFRKKDILETVHLNKETPTKEDVINFVKDQYQKEEKLIITDL